MTDKHNREMYYKTFIQELQNECDYHAQGSTSYRKRSAELSLEVARKTKSVAPFFQSESALQTVSRFLVDEDQERIKDVSKMLRVVANSVRLDSELPYELKEYIQEKRINRKPLSFKKK